MVVDAVNRKSLAYSVIRKVSENAVFRAERRLRARRRPSRGLNVIMGSRLVNIVLHYRNFHCPLLK